MKQRVLVITGPTACGKSDLALALAQQLDGEIISVDSLAVYRGFDIGSAKPTVEQQATVPHHLLNIRDPLQPFTAADFRQAATAAIADITRRGKRPILAGGTGLYLRALLRGLTDAPGEDPQLRQTLRLRAEQEGTPVLLQELRAVDPVTADRLHPNNLIRIIRALEVVRVTGVPLSQLQTAHGFSERPFESLQFCLERPREQLYRAIEQRVDTMLAAGLLAEVQQLLASGVPVDCKPMQAIGYKEVAAHLHGNLELEQMTALIKRNTRRFAKRQLTWFKAEPELQWVAYPENSATILKTAALFFR